MLNLLEKYEKKLVDQGLCDSGTPLLAGLDADMEFNRQDPWHDMVGKIFAELDINSLIVSKMAEPYHSMWKHLAAELPPDGGTIRPRDNETRTFLHGIPVRRDFTAKTIIETLKHNKAVVFPDHALVTFGTISPEQAFVVYSSVCFAGFVKFCSDLVLQARSGNADEQRIRIALDAARAAAGHIHGKPVMEDAFRGPFASPRHVRDAMSAAGSLVVNCRMVDSFMGNISILHDDILYITQTAASLDELTGCIDPCPVDGSSTVGITASSEFSAHMNIIRTTGYRAILHGHPRFAVIGSLDCDDTACPLRGRCHVECPKKRFLAGIPIVPGESGTGSRGLCHTVPAAMAKNGAAIVYGHGLFAAGKTDLNDAFSKTRDIELSAIDIYMKKLSRDL